MTIFRTAILLLLCLMAGCQTQKQSAVEPSYSLAHGRTPAATSSAPGLGYEVQQTAYVEQAESAGSELELLEPAPTPSPNQPWNGELTLEQLEGIALASNPSLTEARARVDAARGKWLQVGLLPNTVVGYSGQQLGSGGLAEQQGVFIGQEIVRGGKLRLNRAIADQEIIKAEQLWSAQEQRVLTDVRLGYYEVLISQRRNEVTQRLVDIADDAVQTADKLYQAMEVSRVDVVRARGATQMAQLLRKNAQNRYTAAWSRLLAVLGTAEINPRPLVGELESVASRFDEQEMLERLLVESPEMAVAVADMERAEWAIERACVEPIPNVDVQAIWQADNGTGSSNANLQLTLPIPWIDRNQGGVRAAEAELIAANHAIARVELNLKRRLATVFQRYASALNQVEDYSQPEGILDNAKVTLDFIQKGYEVGEVAYLDLLTAQTAYSQTNLAYIEALGELWAATVEIEGLLLKDSLSGGGERP